MTIYILIDWDTNHIIGAYSNEYDAISDKNKFSDAKDLHVIKRDLIGYSK